MNLINKLKSNKILKAVYAVAFVAAANGAMAADAFITTDPSTGDITVNASPIAVKLIGIVGAMVVAFTAIFLFPSIIGWLKRMIRG